MNCSDLLALKLAFVSAATIFQWSQFVDTLQQKTKTIPLPFEVVGRLATFSHLHLNSQDPVLDVGCETGKNAFCLVKAGHQKVPATITSGKNSLVFAKKGRFSYLQN